MKIWSFFINTGLRESTRNVRETRSILMANQITLFIFIASCLFFGTYWPLYGWNLITTSLPIVGILSLFTLYFNSRQWFQLGKFWLCCLLPVTSLLMSIASKKTVPLVQDSEYYEFRFVLYTSAFIPCLLFSIKEKSAFITTLLVNFVALFAFDLIHNFFDVGYYQTGQKDGSYYYTNVVIFLTFATAMAGFIFLKSEWESSEDRNHELIHDLEDKNKRINEQNTEMIAQSEILNLNQEKLSEANQIIEKQKELLSNQNKHLEFELIEKNKELTQTNSELIKYNTELRQFSFTVSHNLRGPVASLLGLVELIDHSHVDAGTKEVLMHIKGSAHHLDSIINDLRKIIDIRHDIFRVRQRVNFEHEISKIRHLFEDKLVSYEITIKEDFECPEIFSVKPMIHSILYNLISNSIKYRSPERKLNITVSTREDEDHYILKVVDNGLGIDIQQHRENLFKLYRRFHLHTEGKGLGLYLVKLQCESLGGYVSVDSEVNKFTSFTVYLKKPSNVNRQILYNETYALIFYDAFINSMGIVWRNQVTSDQYREAFNKCLEFLKVYNTPNWISDLSDQGPVQSADQQWMLAEILPAAARSGLRRIAAIKATSEDLQISAYVQGIRATSNKLGIDQQFFGNIQQGIAWIQVENEKSIDAKIP